MPYALEQFLVGTRCVGERGVAWQIGNSPRLSLEQGKQRSTFGSIGLFNNGRNGGSKRFMENGGGNLLGQIASSQST